MASLLSSALLASATSSMAARIPSSSSNCFNALPVSTLPVTYSGCRIYYYQWCSSYAVRRRNALRASVGADATLKEASEDDAWAGVAKYKPETYDELVSDASKALVRALEDQHKRLEIEFPPLPSTISGYKGTSDEFIDANFQLALALAQNLHEAKGLTCHIVFPDMPESRRALRIFRSALELVNCVTLGSLDDIPGGAGKGFLRRLRSAFDFDFGEVDEDKLQSHGIPSLYIFVNCSTSELLDVEKYLETFAVDIPAVLFNLELDTLRADLGIFGFPSKDLQYRFLSQFLPVFYIRTRNYSKTIPAAPFVLDYAGALFRQYPGPWQVMLKQSDSSYVCVAENSQRFTLGQTKEELLTALGLQEEDGSALAFLRRGYKNSTWWEDDFEIEKSSTWRS